MSELQQPGGISIEQSTHSAVLSASVPSAQVISTQVLSAPTQSMIVSPVSQYTDFSGTGQSVILLVLEAPAQAATVPSAPLHFMPSGMSFTSKCCI